MTDNAAALALQAALAHAGCPGHMEARGKLAVLVLADAERLADERLRRTVLRLATEHGFSHLAIELADGASDAAPVHSAESSR